MVLGSRWVSADRERGLQRVTWNPWGKERVRPGFESGAGTGLNGDKAKARRSKG